MATAKETAMKHMGETKEKPKKTHVHKIEIERGTNGGHVITKHHRDEHGNHAGTTGPHVAANNDDMHDQVDQAMGDQPAAGEGQAPGATEPAAPAADPTAQVSQGM